VQTLPETTFVKEVPVAHIVVIASETEVQKQLRATLEKTFDGGLEFYRTFAEAVNEPRGHEVDAVVLATQYVHKRFYWGRIRKHFQIEPVVLIMTDRPNWDRVYTTFDENRNPIYKIMSTRGIEPFLTNVLVEYVQARRSITRILQR
jgi:hypothetical protein